MTRAGVKERERLKPQTLVFDRLAVARAARCLAKNGVGGSMSTQTTKTTPPSHEIAEYYQLQSARNAVAREIARMIGRPSEKVMEAKVKADAAVGEYREAIREAARTILENL